MTKAQHAMGSRWNILIFLLIVAVIVVLDQFSKQWIRDNVPLGGSLPAMGSLTVVHVQNDVGMCDNKCTAKAVGTKHRGH